MKSKPIKAANSKTLQTKEEGEDVKDVNQYSVLKEDVEDSQAVVEEERDDDGSSKKYEEDQTVSPKERIYDVNKMDIEGIQAFLKENQEDDSIMKNDERIECDGEVSVEMEKETYNKKENKYKKDLLKESSNDKKDNNVDEHEMCKMLIKAEKDFRDEINEVKVIKMKLFDKLKTLEEERKDID